MSEYTILISTTFGVESVVKHELRKMNYDIKKVKNGRIEIEGNGEDLAYCNLKLRSAERVFLKLAEFPARDFDELYDNVSEINWPEILPWQAEIPVSGKSVKSALHSVPACQSIIKKAIVDSMQEYHGEKRLPETGNNYPVFFSLYKDNAIIALDSSGEGLHKRGYRQETGDAPLQETIAAAMINLSRWDRDRILLDPLCGSGTIIIEAALMARNIPPGLKRSFTGEKWDFLEKKCWKKAREKAKNKIKNNREARLLAGYDKNNDVIEKARYNARRAGVEDLVHFQQRNISQFSTGRKYGYIITNPPYGERLKQEKVEKLYSLMGDKFIPLDTWSYYILTSYANFEKAFGMKASKRRKLYNGGIECQYYQYYGPWPPANGGDR